MSTIPSGPYFKVLSPSLGAYHGGSGKWTVGEWRSVRGVLEPCAVGLHIVTAAQLPGWLGPVICPFEPAPDTEIIDADDKLVCRKGRIGEPYANWNERTMRLFACDCAERVLANFEERYPDDKRPREAIAVARRFANGEATREELGAATSSATYSAISSGAYSAAFSATSSAERAWQSERLMEILGVTVNA